jgi:hypothetical protein
VRRAVDKPVEAVENRRLIPMLRRFDAEIVAGIVMTAGRRRPILKPHQSFARVDRRAGRPLAARPASRTAENRASRRIGSR